MRPGRAPAPRGRGELAPRSVRGARSTFDPRLRPPPKRANTRTINAAAGTALWNHTGIYGGAGKGGEWKVEYTFKVPRTLSPGKSASISLSLKASDLKPEQPLSVEMSATAPDFKRTLSINYPNPAEASKVFTFPISAGYKDFKEIEIRVGVLSAEVIYTYQRVGG